MKRLFLICTLTFGFLHAQNTIIVSPPINATVIAGDLTMQPLISMQDTVPPLYLPATGDSYLKLGSHNVFITECDSNNVSNTSHPYIIVGDKTGQIYSVTAGSLKGYDQGTATVSGTLLQTAYVITHGLGYTPTQVYIQPRSANAAALSWVTNITSTTFTITFISVPVIGTNNISFWWTAYK